MNKILNQLINQEPLTRDQSREVLLRMAREEFSEIQMAAFMTTYLMRSIGVEELTGFREALLELAIPLKTEDHCTIDLCGTGGDGKNTFNISTLASLVTAAAGYKVTKHGNYGVSSVSGSSDVLEYLGYTFTNDNDILLKQLDRHNICFMHAPLFHPAMKAVGPVRRGLKVKTFFNLLGPLVNPAQPHYQMVGVFNLQVARLYHYLLQESDKQFTVVHSLDGYDEISLTGGVRVITNVLDSTLDPADLGLSLVKESELNGGDSVETAASIFMKILEGKGTQAQNSVVIANAALAIRCFNQNKTLNDCVGEATDALSSGKALATLKAVLS